jgi:TRAP-type mannitol/chloroaromatic compound transport system substrate-binding protein
MKCPSLSALGLIIVGILGFVLAACERPTEPEAEEKAATVETVTLKVPIAFATTLPALGTTIKWIGDRIEIASNGSVKMKIYEPGKLVAPFEILDAVSSGKVNAGYAAAGYWAGKMPASPLFSAIPFGPEAAEYLAWMWHGNGGKLYQEMYDQAGYNVKVLPCGILAPETSGWFSQPIKSAADLQGLKMRFYGLGGQVMQKLGVSTTLLPGGEIFPALEKKAIDATEFSMPAIDERLGFYKLVKYNYFPGWHQQASILELLINKDTWDKMHESQRMVTELMCQAGTADSLAFSEAIQFDVMQRNVEKHGVTIEYWSDDMLALFKRTWEEVAAEQAAKDPFFKKVLDDLSQFRAKYDIWEAYAFLPRAQPKK